MANANLRSGDRQQEHLPQFYATDEYLIDVIVAFLAPGLRGGSTALLVATFEHFSATLAALALSGIDVKRLRTRGKLVWVDARMLSRRATQDAAASQRIFDIGIAELVAN